MLTPSDAVATAAAASTASTTNADAATFASSGTTAAPTNNNPPPAAAPAAPPDPVVATTNWARFHDWLHAVCVVTFDLELGQALELLHPAGARLSEAERSAVCYLAFPDSNSGCMGDTAFHVRLRRAPAPAVGGGGGGGGGLSATHRRWNGRCEARAMADEGHWWGFVYFRQVRDVRRPRGYFQKVNPTRKTTLGARVRKSGEYD